LVVSEVVSRRAGNLETSLDEHDQAAGLRRRFLRVRRIATVTAGVIRPMTTVTITARISDDGGS